MAGPIVLDVEGWRLVADPAHGGRIVSCFWQGHPILVPGTPGVPPEQEHAGSFPLVPFSNRIESASFPFQGQTITLHAPEFLMPFALHGHGWRSPWQVSASTPSLLVMEYVHRPRSWPWPYRAVHRVRLSEQCLQLTIELCNLGDGPMPAGIGFHPYFPPTDDMHAEMKAGGIWHRARTGPPLPSTFEALDPAENFFEGRAFSSLDLDNCFTGWDRSMRLVDPAQGLAISMTASQAFSNLVVYCPPGEGLFCAEPVSHVNNAARIPGLPADQALDLLDRGECLSGSVMIEVLEL